MNAPQSSSNARQRVLVLSTLAALVLAACDKAPQAPAPALPDAPAAAQPVPLNPPAPQAAPVRSAAPISQPVAAPAPPPYEARPQPVYTGYRAPISQPAPIAVPWAPPPMRVEEIPPQPSPDANWAGGYWVWREGWAWAPGYWATPPRPRYHWVPPYYEHRQDRVVFVDGFWSPPGAGFVRPAVGVTIALAAIGAAVAIGHPPVGPEGIFVPPPPGSRPGLIVPAPIGTAPGVVVRAPAIIAPGMRVSTAVTRVDNSVHKDVRNTTITNNRNTTVVNHITNVTIEAPASAMANHQAMRVSVPSQPHLVAAMAAPEAATRRPAALRPPEESPIKQTLPMNRTPPPGMHAERAAPAEPSRVPPGATQHGPQGQPAHDQHRAAPEAKPPAPAQPRPAPPPAARATPPAPQAPRPPRPEHEAAPHEAHETHEAAAPHPAVEKPKPHEAAAHKPNGDPREEKDRREREPR